MRFNIKKTAILTIVEDTNNPEVKVYTVVEQIGKVKQMYSFVGTKNDEIKKYIGKLVDLNIGGTTKEEVFEIANGEKKYVESVSFFIQNLQPHKQKGDVSESSSKA